ncbi:MAG: hypothetical protein HWE27_13900 [Gammaproteobacteria bacterium]|nr:hypothetical protein [Gammaproteobacteria bacterium]
MSKLTANKILMIGVFSLVIWFSWKSVFTKQDSALETNLVSSIPVIDEQLDSPVFVNDDSSIEKSDPGKKDFSNATSENFHDNEITDVDLEQAPENDATAEQEYAIAYAEDTGLELTFFDDSEEVDSSQDMAEHEAILDEQLLAYESEINNLKQTVIEDLDTEQSKQALEQLISLESSSSTEALIDILFNASEHRTLAAKGLIARLGSDNFDKQLIVDTLEILSNDYDIHVAEIAQQAIKENRTELH